MTDLDKLIELIENGQFSASIAMECLPHPYELSAMSAHDGSLDAAKALHDALLPTTNQYSIVADPTCIKASVHAWPNGLRDANCAIEGEGWSECNPARAWIIAILKAYRSLQ